MLELIIAGLCGIVVGYLVLLLRSFEYLSLPELKRQARRHKQARRVYAVRGVYGAHIFIVLWALIGAFTAVMILLLEMVLWGWVAILIVLVTTVVIHAVLPWSKYPAPSLGMASVVSPIFAYVLRIFSPILNVTGKLTGKWISRTEIKRINSKDELLDILEHTRISDDPFSKDELSIAVHALTFGDKSITAVMTPRSVMKTVRASDVLSPVLLGDLYASGFSRFPVIESERGDFVGILYSKDLADVRKPHLVRDVMRSEVFYVNEFSSLDNVLNAFLRTQHHLFLVVNEFEEIVGLVTIEDVLEQIIGKKIIDEFDRYDDLREVAHQLTKKRAEIREAHTIPD